jgi:transcriptional regulator with XRE-family HTH domain
MELTSAQTRAARALLDLSQLDLAKAAQISEKTLVDFERGQRRPYGDTLARIRAALERNGVIFIPGNGDGPGVRLAKKGRGAKRSA